MKESARERWAIFIHEDAKKKFDELAKNERRTQAAQFDIVLEAFLKSLQEKI